MEGLKEDLKGQRQAWMSPVVSLPAAPAARKPTHEPGPE